MGGIVNSRTTTRIVFGLLVLSAFGLSIVAQQAPTGAGGGRGRGQAQPLPLFFKETWKQTAGNIPLTQDAVANPDLVLAQYGPGNKDDFGMTSEGNMNHIWTGLCNSACAIG